MPVSITSVTNEKYTKSKKMKAYDIKIRVETENPADCQTLGNLLQNAVNVVAHSDMVKLLSKVKQNPSIVKTALKFI